MAAPRPARVALVVSLAAGDVVTGLASGSLRVGVAVGAAGKARTSTLKSWAAPPASFSASRTNDM